MKRVPAAGLLVGLAAVIAFLPVLRNGFVDFDDDLYLLLARRVCEGPDRLRFLFQFHDGNYVPLSWLLLGLDQALGGGAALAYHLASVALHAADAVLFFLAARELFDRRSSAAAAFAALVFAVHPLRVQSVAWMSDQRDLLAGFFSLVTVLLWLRGRRTLALAPFAAALLSKPTALPLPAALALLDVYRGDKGRVKQLAPFFALSAVFSAVAFAAQSSAAAVAGWTGGVLAPTLARAGVGLFFYLGKFLWPVRLSLYEWRWGEVGPATLLGLAATAALAVIAARVERWRAPIASALAFQWIMLSPVLAVSLGHELAADRYSYLSGLGLALLAGGAFAELARLKRTAALGAAALVCALLARATWAQSAVWRDGVSFWRRVVRLDPASNARVGLFSSLAKSGRAGEAVLCLEEHVRLHPDDERAKALFESVIDENKLTEKDLEDFRAQLARERAYGRETCP